ncbi:MAG TPA: DALR domain-containing protein, partial [Negativicutes bacterium]|nr:DALR domain-containing protein [Negativicutes bacterium]
LEAFRLFMLSAHYRSPVNFSGELLEQAKNALDRLYNAKNNLEYLLTKVEDKPLSQDEEGFIRTLDGYRNRFIEVMDDDLNTADGLSVIFDMVRDINTAAKIDSSKQAVKASHDILMELAGVLGLLYKKEESLDTEIENLIAERQKARKEKNWALSDKIRDDLKAQGIILEDTPEGVKWKRV